MTTSDEIGRRLHATVLLKNLVLLARNSAFIVG
jgi:hypothetical protein